MYKKIMYWSLILQLVSILCLTAYVFCAEITLHWDANNPVPEGYRVFQTVAATPFDYGNPVYETTETTLIVNVPKDILHIFCVRAFIGASQSLDSNWVYYIDESQGEAVYFQTRPKNVRITFE